jgi:hypothetical protein
MDIKNLFDELGESSKIINIRNYLGKELNSINENSNFGIYFVTSVKEGIRKTTKVMIVQ